MSDPVMIMEGRVGPQYIPDGMVSGFRMGRTGEQLASEVHGKYVEQVSRGNVYFGTTLTAGIALIVAATTGNHPSLWNPAGSGFVASLVKLTMSYISGANAPTALYWHLTQNAGSAIGTAAPVVTWTNVAPVNCRLGSSNASAMKWAPAVNTYTAAPPYLCGVGVSLDTMASTSTNAPFVISIDYDGVMQLPPGNVLSLCTQASTTTALFNVTLYWEELPV